MNEQYTQMIGNAIGISFTARIFYNSIERLSADAVFPGQRLLVRASFGFGPDFLLLGCV